MRFNNVAYQMAVLNVDLHTAQHYAETGLAALVSKMRSVSLEQVGVDDGRMTTWISYLWGTLGWILFEEDRVPEAEKYIKSAWLLRSHGEIGYNLGRVYEAQGRRDDAIRTYELSLSASEPYAEARQRLALLLGGDSEIDHHDEVLRPFTKELEAAAYPDTFPEATEVRLLRRRRLACVRAASTPCRLLLASAETVRTDE